MPNISFDIFYNTDIVNITASRSGNAPRVKPGWKVRQAPKLGPRQIVTPSSAFGNKALQSSQSAGRDSAVEERAQVEELESSASESAADNPLKVAKKPKSKGNPIAATHTSSNSGSKRPQKPSGEKRRAPPKASQSTRATVATEKAKEAKTEPRKPSA